MEAYKPKFFPMVIDDTLLPWVALTLTILFLEMLKIFKKITNNKKIVKKNMDIFKNILSLEIKIS